MKRRTATIISPVTEGRFGPNLWRDERGVIAIIAVLLLTVMVGMAALVVDLGWLYVVRGELQNGADAGALAGAVELVLSGSSEAEDMAVSYAIQSAQYHLTQPPPGAGAVAVTILPSGGGGGGEDDDDDDDDDDNCAGDPWLRVRVGPAQVPAIFARVLGIQTSDVVAVAVARLERRIIGTGPGNLLPFAVNRDLVNGDDDDDDDDDESGCVIGMTVDIYPHTGSPGNFGLLDFDGGGSPIADTIDWIENGFGDIFVIPEGTGFVNVEGNTGIPGGSLSGAITSRLGDRVLFPVFDEFTGEGANASFEVVDLVGGMIQSFQLIGTDSERHITVQIVEFSSPDLIVGGGSTSANSSVSTPVLIE